VNHALIPDRRSFFSKGLGAVALTALLAAVPAQADTPFQSVIPVIAPFGTTVDASSAIRQALATASLYTGSRTGSRIGVSLGGRTYGIGSAITFTAIHNIELMDGGLYALATLSGPVVKFGTGTSTDRPYNCGLFNVQIECNHTSAGILIDDSVGHRFEDVYIYHQDTYGLKTQTNSGGGRFTGVQIAQYLFGETGYNDLANRTANGFDINTADDTFSQCLAWFCRAPLTTGTSGGSNIYSTCHFFNGGTSGTDNIAIEILSASNNNSFVGCEFDNGIVSLVDSFNHNFGSCFFQKNSAGNQTSAFKFTTSTASSTAGGFACVGGHFNFGSYTNGMINRAVTGDGSWIGPQITWTGNHRSDGTELPFDDWTTGYLDSHRRNNRNNVVAHAGGGIGSATPIVGALNRIATVQGANDSVLLPPAYAGKFIGIKNDTVNSAQVFATGTDTVDGIAGSTGIAHAGGKMAFYLCIADGTWFRLLSA
jgi:hypothetical protein